MRVLIADKLHSDVIAQLKADGFELICEPKLSGDSLTTRLSEVAPEVLVVRSTKVQDDQLSASPALALVIRAGAGVNSIDLNAASSKGIFVANCPGKNAVAVAELAMGLMLSLDRHLPDNVASGRNGQWNKAAYSKATGLAGRTLGLVGFGNIAQEVAKRALAFDMPVVAYSRSLTDDIAAQHGVRRAQSLHELAGQSDIVSVHLALNDQTRGIMDADVFSAMRRPSVLLNTSRAAVVDEAAMSKALDEGWLQAGLDVVEGEPSDKCCPFEHPLAKHPQVHLTHHIGASTNQAQLAVAAEVARVLHHFHTDGQILNCVNPTPKSTATHRVVVRHKDEVGVLARVLGCLSNHQLNVQEMENLVFSGGAALARIKVTGQVDDTLVTALGELQHVNDVSVRAL